MSTPVRAVVFDFDGLVLDTETPVYTAWAEAFDAHGCPPLALAEYALEVGSANVLDIVGMLRARASRPVDVDEMHRIRRTRRDELLGASEVLPGVETWLDEADRLGIAIAIASSSPYDWVHSHLDRLGLRHRFVHVSCRDDAARVPPKPAPDVYLRACAALDVEPRDAIALEDSPNGIAAAKAAGLRCVAVPNQITASLDFRQADVVLGSLAERSLHDVVQHLGAR
jgi:HAD superfamily hydrolase (TIGR01509 family)